VSDPAPRIAPRSAGAAADVALLRAARTDPAVPETAVRVTFGERLLGRVSLRLSHPRPDAIVVRVDGNNA
jgi:hypothetical protein